MSNPPDKRKRVSRLEAWAFAFATEPVAVITIGVVPTVHW